ncbi:MAG: bifunctional riboflavin kinase/FAD synthetase [Gammaproteobacteria bacterium]|nr:bifunctional riboflavin kinase/FAD synthetase [Gammaproteobacteria bacterium]
MELIRGWHNVREKHRGCVLTLGNFDGVHKGHQALLQRLLQVSQKNNSPSLVMIFEPQPNEFFYRDKKIGRLMRLREKVKALHEISVDRVLVGKFNNAFAHITAENFVAEYLVGKLGVKHIIVGDDLRFGFERRGDFNLLVALGEQYGFTVEKMPTFEIGNERTSSTLIRQALIEGDMGRARKLLGHGYAFSGRVAHGDKIGRTIGFPTANIHLHRLCTPVEGVFAVLVTGLGPHPIKGAANVGSRPTVGGKKIVLEVYLFDFNEDIYGRHVEVEFVQKIREEETYETIEAMQVQIEKDVEKAKAILEDLY